MSEVKDATIKILLIGESGVGKSSLLLRFSEDTLFNLNCAINNPSILNIDRIVYLTYFNPDSSSNKDWDYFIKEASFCHCKGVIELAQIYKDKNTAVFDILVNSLLEFQERFISYIDLSTAIRITIHIIYNILKPDKIDGDLFKLI